MKKNLTLFILFGIFYNFIEVCYTALVGWSFSLAGKTSLWMTLVGGFLGVVLGYFNERGSHVRSKPILIQCLLGGLYITVLEFLSGLLLNVALGFNLWDYSHIPGNILGQVNPMHSFFWVAITPLAFWLDDVMRFYLYQEEKPKKLIAYYLGLFR